MTIRLYDQVLASPATGASLRQELGAVSARVLAGNVARLLYLGPERQRPDWEAFPNLAPPFPSFWVEAKVPREGIARYSPQAVGMGEWTIGSLSSYVERADAQNLAKYARAGWWNAGPAVLPSEARWLAFHTLFAGSNVVAPFEMSTWSFAVDAAGRMVKMTSPQGSGYFLGTVSDTWERMQQAQGSSPDEQLEDLHSTRGELAVTLLTISLLHCKNVTLRVQPGPAAKSRKKNRHRPPRAAGSYQVIDIDPMRTVLRTEGRSEQVGLGQALHICRGHFADHRERGLFGREALRGIFWVPMHVRGSLGRGGARKDYEVRPGGSSGSASTESSAVR